MDEMAKELKDIFLDANNELLKKDKLLFDLKVSERTICGALMNKIYDRLKNSSYSDYYVDVEYNRNRNHRKKIKTCYIITNNRYEEITINCDLIVHSRGQNAKQDNLIAIEMKKSNRLKAEKIDDKYRLISLTNNNYSLPEHVCKYKLGIYYELNFNRNTIFLEYYYKGEKITEDTIKI